HNVAAYNRVLRDEVANTERELESARVDARREADVAASLREEDAGLRQQVRELQANQESNEVLRAKLGVTRAELETTAALLSLHRQKEGALDGEIAAGRRESAAAGQETERLKALRTASEQSLSALCKEARMPELVPMVRAGGFLFGRDNQARQM